MENSVPRFSVDYPSENLNKKNDRGKEKIVKLSSASSLLKYAGSWQGDDFEECLGELYFVRGKTNF